MFSLKNLKIERYIKSNPKMSIKKDGKMIFINFNKQITKNEISQLLEELWINKFEIAFHDTIHPTISDPGAYFNYSTDQTINEEYWSMTFGNHGWSGGIYHLRKETVNQQIYNLIKKENLDKIKITEVNFFSNYEIKSKEESIKKDKEILSMHT